MAHSARLHLEALEDRTLPSTSIPLSTAAWTALGPEPIVNGQANLLKPDGQSYFTVATSGRVTGIALGPSMGASSTIYIATAGGGIWRTTDGGTTWAPLTDHVTDENGNPVPLYMGCIAVDPVNPSILYAGTGEANNNLDNCFAGRGILKSSNAGASWTLLDNGGVFEGKTMAKIVIDPLDDQTLYAAVDDNGTNGSFSLNNGKASDTGIYKSTDGGMTWSDTTASISTTDVYSDLAIDPNTPSTLYMAIGTPTGDGIALGSDRNGVYKSTDSGTTWTRLPVNAGLGAGRITLALADDSRTLYVSIVHPGTPNTLSAMLKSTDGGASFTRLTATPNYLGSGVFGQGDYDTALAVEPGHPEVVVASGCSSAASGNCPMVIATTNGGKSWFNVSFDRPDNTGPHTDSHALLFDGAGGLLEGDDGGIFRLTNLGGGQPIWEWLNNTLETALITGIALDPTNADVAYIGTQDNGSDKFQDSLGWHQFLLGDGGSPVYSPANPSAGSGTPVVLGQQPYSNDGAPFIFGSQDAWVSGQNYVASNGLSGGGLFYTPLVADPTRGGRIYWGGTGLFRSADYSVDWKLIGFPGEHGFNPNFGLITSIAVAPSDPNTIYVIADTDIFVTTQGDKGGQASWSKIDIPGVSSGLSGIAVDPANPQYAYVVRNVFEPGAPYTAGTGKHVYMTSDGGKHWTDISAGLLNVPAWSIAIDPRGTPSTRTLYVGTDVGVYTTSNGGTTWSTLAPGLPFATVDGLELVPSLDILAAGTYGRGLFEILLADKPDLTKATLAVSAGNVQVNGTLDVTLTAFDKNGTQRTGGSAVQFVLGAGSAGGTFGTVIDNGNGTYTASFTPSAAGTSTITATIDGKAITATIQATATGAGASMAESTVAVNKARVPAGTSETVTLIAFYGAGNQESNGGLAVTFHLGKGKGRGTFGPVSDNGDGTYTATFTATVPGQNTIVATINGKALTSAPATITITAGPPQITTASLPDWTLGFAYKQTVAARFDSGALSFAVTSGALPAGLRLNARTGAITGTPAATGTSSFTITVTDATHASAGQAYTVTISPAVTISTTSLAGWTADAFGYDQTVAAQGGTGPLVFSVSQGLFPYNLSLDPNTGTISGGPSTPGTFRFTIQATDSVGASARQTFTVIIQYPVTVSPATLPGGLANRPYQTNVSAAGGTGGITFSVGSGALPAGLSLDPGSGAITGMPTSVGVFDFTIEATDSTGAVGSRAYEVAIGTFALTPSLPDGQSGVAYRQQIVGRDGTPPYRSFMVTSGSLPPGLTLGATSGVVSGKPTKAGDYTFTVQASDSSATLLIASQSYTLRIDQAPAITSAATVTFQAGIQGSFQLAATGLPAPTLSLGQKDVLPQGITFDPATDMLGGTAAAGTGGVYTLHFTAANGIGNAAVQTFLLVIDAAPVITMQPQGQIVAAGGTATFTAAADAMPAATVQWQESVDGTNFSDIQGATSTRLSFVATMGRNRNYFRAVFSNVFGQATSYAVRLSVT
jgi:photosystem II stability/assembly factor-like uncharacterized protein